jgi:hypothetical protein
MTQTTFEPCVTSMRPYETYTSGSTIALEFFFFIISGLWGYWHCGQSWPIVPASGDGEDDCGEADGM